MGKSIFYLACAFSICGTAVVSANSVVVDHFIGGADFFLDSGIPFGSTDQIIRPVPGGQFVSEWKSAQTPTGIQGGVNATYDINSAFPPGISASGGTAMNVNRNVLIGDTVGGRTLVPIVVQLSLDGFLDNGGFDGPGDFVKGSAGFAVAGSNPFGAEVACNTGDGLCFVTLSGNGTLISNTVEFADGAPQIDGSISVAATIPVNVITQVDFIMGALFNVNDLGVFTTSVSVSASLFNTATLEISTNDPTLPVTIVPIPAPVFLLGVGLFGLLSVRLQRCDSET